MTENTNRPKLNKAELRKMFISREDKVTPKTLSEIRKIALDHFFIPLLEQDRIDVQRNIREFNKFMLIGVGGVSKQIQLFEDIMFHRGTLLGLCEYMSQKSQPSDVIAFDFFYIIQQLCEPSQEKSVKSIDDQRMLLNQINRLLYRVRSEYIYKPANKSGKIVVHVVRDITRYDKELANIRERIRQEDKNRRLFYQVFD